MLKTIDCTRKRSNCQSQDSYQYE